MMTFDTLKARIADVEKLENRMLRPLTEDEKQFVLKNGIIPFIEDYLEFDKNDDFTFDRVKALISAYCTESHDRFVEELEKENGDALAVFKTLVNALEDEATREAEDEVMDSPEKGSDDDIDKPVDVEAFLTTLLKSLGDGDIKITIK